MRRFFVSTFLIILLLSPSSLCPTLAYTGNAPENSTQTLDIQLNQTGTPDTDLNKTQPDIEEVPPPVIEAYASPTSGSSPLFVTFTGVVHSRVGAVLIYKWDFDGDGLTDYASGDSGNTSHAYTVSSPKKCQARFTVVYRDGTEVQETVTVTVEPVRKSDWHEIRDLGLTVFGLHTNGTIYLYDETSWLPLDFYKDGKLLRHPSFRKIDEAVSRLTYNANSSLLDVTLHYGVAGRALFEFTEYAAPGIGGHLAGALLGKASTSLTATFLSYGVQSGAEIGNYAIEKALTHEPVYWEEVAVQVGFSVFWSGLSDFAFRPISRARYVSASPAQTSQLLKNVEAADRATVEVVGTSLSSAIAEQVAPYPWTFPEFYYQREPIPSPYAELSPEARRSIEELRGERL